MKLDILAFAAHPDDTELACSGILASHIAEGKKVGVVDLTRGELGTRGSADLRNIEAQNAAKVLGLHMRENLKFADVFFKNDEIHQKKIIQSIRTFQPEIILANAIEDRHIDHGRAAKLVHNACFLSGLRKIITQDNQGNSQEPWRPKFLFHYIQDYYLEPDIIIDITPFWEKKIEAIKAFSSQFYQENNDEPTTPISTPDFFNFLEARAREMGRMIGVEMGEGLISKRPLPVKNLLNFL